MNLGKIKNGGNDSGISTAPRVRKRPSIWRGGSAVKMANVDSIGADLNPPPTKKAAITAGSPAPVQPQISKLEILRKRQREKQAAESVLQQQYGRPPMKALRVGQGSNDQTVPGSRENSPEQPNTTDRLLFTHLRNTTDYVHGNPLINSEQQYNEMFAKIPDKDKTYVHTVGSKLRCFRHIQANSPVPIADKQFLTMYLSDGLDRPDQERSTVISLPYGNDQPNISTTSEFGPGLKNWRFTCFINASLQSFSHMLRDTPFIDAMKAVKFPDEFEDDDPKNLPEHIQKSIPKDIYRAMSAKGVSPALYVNFHRSFLELHDALCSDDPSEQAQATGKLEYFLGCYRALGLACDYGQGIARQIFAPCPTGLSNGFRHIRQGDPQEFLNDIIQLLGLNNIPGFAVTYSGGLFLHLKEGEPVAHQMKLPNADTSSVISMEVSRDKDVTLQKCFDKFLEAETLEVYKWEPSELRKAGIPEDADQTDWVTEKTTVLFSLDKSPPSQLVLNAKLYNYRSKLIEEGQKLIQCMDKDIVIPVYPKLEPEDDFSKADCVRQHYRVKNVVCHQGGTVHSGHYITLKKIDSKIVAFNDQTIGVVAELDDKGNIIPGTDTGLHTLVNLGFTGYLFVVEAVPDSDKDSKSE